MRESRRPILPRLGDCPLERPPCAGAVLDLVLPRKALAGPRHQALVALPFVQEHPEPEPAFLVLRDSPKAHGRSVVSLLQQRARDTGDAVDLHASTASRDGVLHRLGKVVQRRFGI